MSKKFTLTIKLGNAEMSELGHVADALREAAWRIEDEHETGPVFDANGNIVGSWEVQK